MSKTETTQHGMKFCPFCSGEPKFCERRWVNQNQGYGDQEYYEVECTICGAIGPTVPYKYFNEFSKHTVEDFRRDNALRSRIEEQYEVYKTEMAAKAKEGWNRRSLIPVDRSEWA